MLLSENIPSFNTTNVQFYLQENSQFSIVFIDGAYQNQYDISFSVSDNATFKMLCAVHMYS